MNLQYTLLQLYLKNFVLRGIFICFSLLTSKIDDIYPRNNKRRQTLVTSHGKNYFSETARIIAKPTYWHTVAEKNFSTLSPRRFLCLKIFSPSFLFSPTPWYLCRCSEQHKKEIIYRLYIRHLCRMEHSYNPLFVDRAWVYVCHRA